MNKFKAVGFDHTGVIVGMSAGEFHQKIAGVLGVSIDDFNKAYVNYNLDFNKGITTKDEFWQLILKELNKDSLIKPVLEIVNKPREKNEAVIDVIKDLKKKGYKLGILSNETIEGGKLIREVEHMGELFDLILISAETGLAKPEKEAFLDFANKFGVAPNEMIYIDDAKRNIETAEKLGMTSILCVEPSKVRGQFEEKGIL